MKIITSEAVYVQKNDIAFLNQTDLAIPASIFLKVFGNGVTIINDKNRFEFVKFEEESEIQFFKELDWIVDYDLVKDLDESQIIELGKTIAKQKNEIAKKYNAMSITKRQENQSMFYECERLEFKMYSLRDILWFKQGQIHFDLPGTSKDNKKRHLGKILSKFKKTHNL